MQIFPMSFTFIIIIIIITTITVSSILSIGPHQEFRVLNWIQLMFWFRFITGQRGGSRIYWGCCDSGPVPSGSRPLPDAGRRFLSPGRRHAPIFGSPWGGERLGNALPLHCFYTSWSSTSRPNRGQENRALGSLTSPHMITLIISFQVISYIT